MYSLLPDFVAWFIKAFANRRLIPLFLLFALTLGSSAYLFTKVTFAEDAAAMLPDGEGAVAGDFALLQRAPFARKITIHLRARSGEGRAALGQAARELAANLPKEYFTNVVAGADSLGGGNLAGTLTASLGRLLTAEDLKVLEAATAPEEVERRVRAAYANLLSPAGFVFKGSLREDPLSLGEIALKKLRHINLLSEVSMADGLFASRDGTSVLIFADTPVSITDSGGAQKLVAGFEAAAAKCVPGTVEAHMIGAHVHTLENARAIQRDLGVILTVSSVAIALILLFFLRGWDSIWVFLLPYSGIAAGAAATGFGFGRLSGITMSFGAVLLGLTVDYGIQSHIACRYAGGDRVGKMRFLANPMLFAGLTTIVPFTMLFRSSLPGQRELALFSVVGLSVCLLAAMLVIPLLTRSGEGTLKLPKPPKVHKAALPLWFAAMFLFGWFAFDARFDGDLKRIGVQSPAIRVAEEGLKSAFGDMRARAILAAEGSGFNEAARRGEELFGLIRKEFPDGSLVSLSPILPSLDAQEENLRRWKGFWTREKIAQVRGNLEKASAPLGFSPDAFAPFLESLTAVPPVVTPALLREAGLGAVVDALYGADASGNALFISLLPDDGKVPEIKNRLRGMEGLKIVSPTLLAKDLGEAVKEDFVRFLIPAALIVTLLAAIIARTPRRTVAALAPPLTGTAALFGVSGMLGIPFDLFNVIASSIVIGATVDYGIFMACREDGVYDGPTAYAVILSAVCTIVGVGSLILASHPALFSIGLTICVGMAAALPTALWVTPLLREGGRGK